MKKKIIGICICTLLIATCVVPTIKGVDYADKEKTQDYLGLERYIKETFLVSMRDGIKLATDVYLPNEGSPPHGSVFIRTPYNKSHTSWMGWSPGSWANEGWPNIIQDTRGQYDSEGSDNYYWDDCKDGPDTLEWIASQNWSNGKIATLGPSSLGVCQYFMAGANPPNLACQFIQVAHADLQKSIYQGGELRKELIELEDMIYNIGPDFYEHENYTLDYWGNVTLDDKWQNVNVPAMHLGGWYDIDGQGLIDAFMGYQYHGGPGALGKSKLIMGPWIHMGWTTTYQGELIYPSNSRDTFSKDMFTDMIEQYTMDNSTDFDSWPTVSYYVMGDVDDQNAPGNEWRYSDIWPIPATDTPFYFREGGNLSTELPSGSNPLTYSYDPMNPVPTIGGQVLNMDKKGPWDQTSVEDRDDVLVFTSPVLTKPVSATGSIKTHLFVSSDCVDTDFTAKLTDVYPDGRSMLITDGILRMRNRNGRDHWDLMSPGQTYEIDINLGSTSYIWNTGHRIRVDISSSNYPRFLTNQNTANSIYDHVINQNNTYIIAHNTLYIDTAHPSCIILPLELNQQPLTFSINGGLGVNLKIMNNGTVNATDVSWQMHVEGGMLGMINKTVNGTVDIPAGDTVTVKTGMLLGFGAISIVAKVADEELTATGTQLLIFSIVK